MLMSMISAPEFCGLGSPPLHGILLTAEKLYGGGVLVLPQLQQGQSLFVLVA